MHRLKKFYVIALLFIVTLFPLNGVSASGLLPNFDENTFKELANDFSSGGDIVNAYNEYGSNLACKYLIDTALREFGVEESKKYLSENENEFTETFLACGIKSGNMTFWMVPFYVVHILGFLIGLAGIIAVLMIIVGAYFYIAGGISDDKEKGKNIIKYAIFGLIVASLAWIAVNFILLLITA